MKLPRLAVSVVLAAAAFAATGAAADTTIEQFEGRDLQVHLPAHGLAQSGRALVVVLHGGMGNASRIAEGRSESGLNLDQLADQHGFVVAYLNGTRAAGMLGANALAWNAGGGCCGLPARNGIDDVRYINDAARQLAAKYAIDSSRIFVMGHSNGGVMTQRLICEPSVFAAGVSISGPLNLPGPSCAGAPGKKVLAIHGSEDANVPIDGGRGSKGISGVAFNSETQSKQVFETSGASYQLIVVPGAAHQLDDVDRILVRDTGATIGMTAAHFFGLSP